MDLTDLHALGRAGLGQAGPGRVGRVDEQTRRPACPSASARVAASTDAPAPVEPARIGITTPNRLQSTGRSADGGTVRRCIAATVAPIPAAVAAGSSGPASATSGATAATACSRSGPVSPGPPRRVAATKAGCSSSTAAGAVGWGSPRSMSCCCGEPTP